MAMIFRNLLSTILTVDDVVFGPSGSDTADRSISNGTLALTAAVNAGQLTYVSGQPDAGDTKLLPEVVATGVEQTVEHGLGQTPSDVGALVTYVPDTGYGGGSGKPFEIIFSAPDDTNVAFTATTGIKFRILVVK